ncbi:MAG: family peptidase [Gammaproteobacteria bacterium]|jgi:dipeptidyl aminopeptidase/acylaminoacyl peptidase|nr:family peptidase [Gammaproteobacteria bacterium]
MSVRWPFALAGALIINGGMVVAATNHEAPLIQRSALFGNPIRAQARLSPDGRYVSFLAPRDGVLNVWLAPFGKLGEAKSLTNDRKRGIRQHYWAEDARHILFLQDEGGDENWRVYSVDVETGRQIDLTPLEKVRAEIVGLSHQRPDVALISLNDRKPEWHDLYEVDVTTGTRRLVERNDQEFAGYLEDLQLRPRVAVKTLADGGGELYRRTDQGWESFLQYGQSDSLTMRPLVIEEGGNTALLLSSVGRDKAALVRVDLGTGKQTVVGQSDKADVSDVWLDPRTRTPQAYGVEYLTEEFEPLTPAAAKDIAHLKAALGPQFQVLSRTNDDSKWVVVVDDPVHVIASYLYDRTNGKVTKLFDHRPELAGAPLRPMKPIEIRARDGFTLVSYLTLPPGSGADDGGAGRRPAKPLPMVLDVHGGPWARDSYGFNAEHQWFANRGYAVLSVNYRGSTGFGKNFINAGDHEWAGSMHNDLLDAVDWAVQEKIAIADKVAIYGGSYGGYAALVGLTFTPERFACGVDIVGPSNLATLIGSIPPYWKSFLEDMTRRIGDPRTEEGRKLLEARSPLTFVERISKPLLIAQGANDPRVKQAEADQIVAAMKKKQLPVTYVLFPDEGHGFARPQNRLAFYAIGEGFLSKCIGGRYEPIGNDFDGSSLTVLQGADVVPGLPEALARLAASPAARANPESVEPAKPR